MKRLSTEKAPLYCNCYPLLPKRLAYPELIPPEFHANHFYDDFDDLVDRLETALRNIEKIRPQSLQKITTRYDWTKMAPKYDETLENVTHLD